MIEIITNDGIDRLNALSLNARNIQAAVAYWTYPPSSLSPAFAQALKAPDSYLIADIHSPTSIGSMAEFKRAGSNVYLYLFQLVGRTESADSKGIADHLMHSKVLVFDYGTDEVKIWVGSHNGTARALQGINFECAFLVTTKRDSQEHRQVIDHLEKIRRLATPFDLDDINLYRTLQGGLGADGFIELVDNEDAALTRKAVISVFGTGEADYQQLKKVGKKLFLSVSHTRSDKERLYRVSISQSGLFNPRQAGVKFDARRYAHKASASIPTLEQQQAVPMSIYTACLFFVTLVIEEELMGQYAIEAPPDSPWSDVLADRYFESTRTNRADAREHDRNPLGKGNYRIQGVNRGDRSDLFETPPLTDRGVAFMRLGLLERQELPSHPLIRKRILIGSEGTSGQSSLLGKPLAEAPARAEDADQQDKSK